MLLRLYYKLDGDDERVNIQGNNCSLGELESLFSKDVTTIPRIAFKRLSQEDCTECIILESKDKKEFHVRKLRLWLLRSGFIQSAFHFGTQSGQSDRRFKLDYEAKYIEFMVHYINVSPYDVDWDILPIEDRIEFVEGVVNFFFVDKSSCQRQSRVELEFLKFQWEETMRRKETLRAKEIMRAKGTIRAMRRSISQNLPRRRSSRIKASGSRG